ncbi:transcriptional repressor NrdR [Candidatus Parcubacteria bacterium]|nr:transcriptional repressor NrdR [Candidatus Parcubacteria bacterium]
MKCPVCLFQDTKVVDSRVAVNGFSIRRRRECLKCGFRFSTYEEIELLDLMIIKRDGRKEAYNKEKLVSGLKRSLEKRLVNEETFKKLVNAIERDLQALKNSEVLSSQIGKIIMKELKKVDKVAFIRFASVYESFEDLQVFQEKLNKLLKNKKK